MEEIDLKELFGLFWSKKIQIILIILIFMLIGVIYTMGFVTPKYSSYTNLVLASSNSNQTTSSTITANDLSVNSKLVSTYSEIVKSKNIIRQVISNLGIKLDEDEVRKNVSVSSVKDTELIKITVTNENPSYSAKIANEMANVFAKKIKEIYNIENIQVLDEAEVETTPSNINHTKDVMIFTFIGVVVAAGYVLIANMLDTTIKSSEEVEKEFKIPVLVSIPLYSFEPVKNKGGKK